jgi:hypothetical protein
LSTESLADSLAFFTGNKHALHLLFGLKTLRSVVQTQREPTR